MKGSSLGSKVSSPYSKYRNIFLLSYIFAKFDLKVLSSKIDLWLKVISIDKSVLKGEPRRIFEISVSRLKDSAPPRTAVGY
jgi:hypothetical protein